MGFKEKSNCIKDSVYIDDGYTGCNFNPPSFQRMIADIEAGKVKCVVTKDLSRLGRNYIEVGSYIEIFFPRHNVRYIAVTDGVDSLNRQEMDITPFKNILNDMYSRDRSGSRLTGRIISAKHITSWERMLAPAIRLRLAIFTILCWPTLLSMAGWPCRISGRSMNG